VALAPLVVTPAPLLIVMSEAATAFPAKLGELLGLPLLTPDDNLLSHSPQSRRQLEHSVIIEPSIVFSVVNLDRLSRRAHVISFWVRTLPSLPPSHWLQLGHALTALSLPSLVGQPLPLAAARPCAHCPLSALPCRPIWRSS
jgi:hypothetical protein